MPKIDIESTTKQNTYNSVTSNQKLNTLSKLLPRFRRTSIA